ncbi:hypothetical protein [Nocardioides marmoriginsengisoli]|uniref:hypothetical protein n=1 Tax=Nocardioides marmoriginsengisoli TaxID=661483 RepID=UPI00160FA762|nr:hypothetical protein [Nocardioides marmoriginsengisoli]
MFGDFLRAFGQLFSHGRSRWEISGLLLTLAMLPVSELVVTRMFSHLIINGPHRYEVDPEGVIRSALVFFVAFALARALHHVVRLSRVRVFRRGFDNSGEKRAASQEAWSWAAAFELSTALVALIQLAAFCILFAVVDLGSGLANVVIVGAVLSVIAAIYRRQLDHQVRYLTEGHASGGTAIGDRVGKRIRDAELGAVVASLAMALSLGVVLYRALRGQIAGADAIVLFIGLRMMYSQVGNLSASAMRFARVKARLTAGPRGSAVVDVDDELDELADLTEDEELPPALPSAHRTQLVNQMLLAGQRGALDEVQRYGARLSVTRVPMESEINAQRAAEAFAELATSGDGRLPLSLMWWPRPFPGASGNWLSPLVLRQESGRPVIHQRPTALAAEPHLVMIGSILGSVQQHSIVVGTGALTAEATPDPRATYLSVRGPLSAAVIRDLGGPAVDAFGDPTVLASRLFPVWRTGSNPRLAFVRHLSHAGVPIRLAEEMDELSALVSRPQEVEGFVRTLATYAGVVTSDPGVAALCDSYRIPHATIAFAGKDDLGFVFRDYALGVGLPVLAPTVVDPDLGTVRWSDVLVSRTIEESRLDEIQASVHQGIASCLDLVTAD